MIGWRRLYPKPAGSLPGGIVTQWGVGIITILVLVFLTYWIYFGGGEEAELSPGTETEQGAARSFADQMAAQVEAESLRAATRRQAAERALQQQGRQQRQQGASGGGIGAGRVSVDEAMLLAGPSPDTGQPYTEEEWELRERLRLEALERRSRSLRSSPVAQTYRQVDRAAADAEGQRAETASPVDAMRAEGAAALEQALDTIGTVTTGLEDEVAAEAQADRAFIEALRGTPTAAATPAVPTASAGPHRRGITLLRPGLTGRMIPPVGSASMKARFWKRPWSRSFPVTFPARSSPWFRCLFIRQTGSASWCREVRGSLARLRPYPIRTKPDSP